MPRIWRLWRDRRGTDATAATAERAALIADYRVAFGGPAGQRVLADLLRRTGAMQTTWAPDGAEAVAFREGRRRVGLEIVETINAEPDAAIAMAQSGMTEDLYDDGH